MHCAFCDREFTPKRATGTYCSTKCRCAAWKARRDARATRLKGLVRVLAKEAGLTAADFA
jgi:predicted nucleic acid-binding Zn ribbon protein